MKNSLFGWTVLFFFLSFVNSAFADTFLVQPYLFSILGKQIAVSWEYAPASLPSANPELVLFQGNLAIKHISASNNNGQFTAILPIPPCGFGSDLGYQVSGQASVVKIAEVPCSSYTGAVHFSFLADAQEGTAYDKKFADLMAMFPGVAILNGGDLVQTGDSISDWRAYFSSMQSVGGTRVLYPAVGNHEYRDSDSTVPFWQKYFGSDAHDQHYSFDLGAAHIMVFNSNFESDPSLKTDQLAWLESELQLPSRWKIVFFHHPGYSVGFFNSPLAPKKEWETIQDLYIPLFEKYKVDLVLNGHVHLFETALKAGVHYITAGPAGGKMGVYGGHDPYKLKSSSTRSIVNLEVAPDHLRALSVGIDGQTLDNLLLTK